MEREYLLPQVLDCNVLGLSVHSYKSSNKAFTVLFFLQLEINFFSFNVKLKENRKSPEDVNKCLVSKCLFTSKA